MGQTSPEAGTHTAWNRYGRLSSEGSGQDKGSGTVDPKDRKSVTSDEESDEGRLCEDGICAPHSQTAGNAASIAQH